ncbi:MAG: SOS response-associated peptidase [Clostridia bacterium]|nr:SOS response-associated peptidase [Clostridia bacterium]
MCGRYYIEPDVDDIRFREALDALNRRALSDPVKTRGEVYPTDRVPVMALSRKLRPSAFAMTWGYALRDGRRVINARSESASVSPLFRDGFARHRCVVPASRYFEWKRDGARPVKYAIAPAGQSALYMAGVYTLRDGLPEFAILTRSASDSVSFIHDRMPVIFSSSAADRWLDPDADPASVLVSALGEMNCEPVEPLQLGIDDMGGPA